MRLGCAGARVRGCGPGVIGHRGSLRPRQRLYGAAIGTGMLTEGHMLAAGAGAKDMSLARQQVLKASGAEGPAVTGVLHWQAGQISQPLKAFDAATAHTSAGARQAIWPDTVP
ncbi:DUF6245 family protein [Streptomyces sp. NPDC048255]|uniref:DUF6245 family protein n=1 Tax=Streptomyces sp. NPDC048255 TaxID=3154713 RepID=UPI0033CD52EE